MNTQSLKILLAGALIGVTLFWLPFILLRVALAILIIGGLFRLFSGRGFRWGRRFPRWNSGLHPAITDTIRRMSTEEYRVFRQKLQNPYPVPANELTQPDQEK
jgi:hypothetical protein